MLPECSKDRVKLYFATEQPPCSCGLNGVINGPDIYHHEDLENLKGDVFTLLIVVMMEDIYIGRHCLAKDLEKLL